MNPLTPRKNDDKLEKGHVLADRGGAVGRVYGGTSTETG
jgi:hypothetical protein